LSSQTSPFRNKKLGPARRFFRTLGRVIPITAHPSHATSLHSLQCTQHSNQWVPLVTNTQDLCYRLKRTPVAPLPFACDSAIHGTNVNRVNVEGFPGQALNSRKQVSGAQPSSPFSAAKPHHSPSFAIWIMCKQLRSRKKIFTRPKKNSSPQSRF